MSAIILWGAGTARTLRPIWMAEELGLAYTLHPISPRTGETQTPAFTALTRKQKVPFFESDAVRLSESLAICRYMQGAFPASGWPVPQDGIAQAKEDEWCAYIYGEIDETALSVIRRHEDLHDIYGAAPEAAASARAYLDRHFAVIDAHLADCETLLESGFGLADLLLVSCLDWAGFHKCALPAHLAAYRTRHARRPAYKKAMKINYAAFLEGRDGDA